MPVHARAKPTISVNGLVFKDLNVNGRLDAYEDWRLPVAARVRDLSSRMTLEEKAGLLLINTLNAEAGGRISERGVKLIRDEKMTRFVFRSTVTPNPQPPAPGGRCGGLGGAQVCDAQGNYSDEDSMGMATRGQQFLRGLQMADAQGNANFVTIYPGWVSRADGAHPDEDGRLQVSQHGGDEPAWSPDGHRLFYNVNESAFAATLSAVGSNLRVARIDSLFENHTRDYSLHPDGKRFALLREVGEGLKLVVTNWLSEAKAKLEKR